ncbi:XTP/dITP diphosphatase [Candidatus Micrarchaeota archaeon]|nr:XTP/dITP diphosphatase [Candidatus Micrarchaeota archaeon]
MAVYFATGNKNKFIEMKSYLKDIDVRHYEFRHKEIRSDSIEEIAREAVDAAYSEVKKPVFVEDTGLFIESLNGFPGTYSGWVYEKIGAEGLVRLMRGEKNRSAVFKTCIAYRSGKKVLTFSGECRGSISEKILGKAGFGYDPVFIPEGHVQSFAQSINLKNKLSHRYKTSEKFRRYLLKSEAI